jgi:tRNA nucleotidyltransferase (CCA-adding enzyme)
VLLDRAVKDWDIATSASPEEVMAVWPECVPTGIKHGTVTAILPGRSAEITTFRTEGPYTDGRRPDWVKPASRLEDDLARRDFTVNAMAFDPETDEFRDPEGGLADLAARRLRTVGDPDRRFREDGLRPLRGVRLAAVLEFTLEEETRAAMARAHDVVARVAKERVRDELMKLMAAPRPSVGIELLRETGLLELWLPELLEGVGMEQNRWHAYDVYEHSLRALDAAPADRPLVRLAALLHDVGKPRTRVIVDGEGTFHRHERVGEEMADRILERLRFSGAERVAVGRLVREHLFYYTPEWSDASVRRFLRRVGPENLADLFSLREADDVAHGTGQDGRAGLMDLEQRIAKIRERAEALRVEDLAVSGHEVMARLGLAPGPQVGLVLRRLLEQVLEDPSRNTRETLLDLAGRVDPRLDDPERGA